MQLSHSARRGIPHRIAFVLASLLLPLFAASCGSGGGPPATSGRITATVDWPARSRAISATASALSLQITLPKGNLDGSDFVWTIDRDNNPLAHVMTVTSAAAVRFGSYAVTILGMGLPSGYLQPPLGGGLVASATASVTISSGRTALPALALATEIGHVAVATTQREIGDAAAYSLDSSSALTFTCRDHAGSAIDLVTPGSGIWALVSSTGFVQLSADGELLWGNAEATATVTVTVDGVKSAPVTFINPYFGFMG